MDAFSYISCSVAAILTSAEEEKCMYLQLLAAEFHMTL